MHHCSLVENLKSVVPHSSTGHYPHVQPLLPREWEPLTARPTLDDIWTWMVETAPTLRRRTNLDTASDYASDTINIFLVVHGHRCG